MLSFPLYSQLGHVELLLQFSSGRLIPLLFEGQPLVPILASAGPLLVVVGNGLKLCCLLLVLATNLLEFANDLVLEPRSLGQLLL